jgi:hypothetical protein
MNRVAAGFNILLVLFFCMLSSCRPPNPNEDLWNRTTQMGNGEVYNDNPGQSPNIRSDYVWDPRPLEVQQADNPDYDKTAGMFGRMWNSIVNNVDVGTGTPAREVNNFKPEPVSEEPDTYDLENGKVRIDPTAGLQGDPEVEEMKERRSDFEEEMNKKNELRDQRDYLESKANADVQRFIQKKVEGISADLIKKTDSLKKDIDASIVEHNQAVDKMIFDEVEDVGGNSSPNGYKFRTAANTINGQRVRSTQYAINSAQKSISQMNGVAKERGEAMVELAQNAVIAADKAYSSGDQEGGDFAIQVATTAVDVGLSLIPGVGLAKDIIEAASGYSIVTGKKLTGFERSMAVVGILTGGYGSALKYAGKAAILADVLKAGKAADEATEIAKATSKATEIAEAAEKVAVKEKRIIDEVAEAVKDGLPCKVALNIPRTRPLDILLSIIESKAYAADCIPGSAEDALVGVFNSAGKNGLEGEKIGEVVGRLKDARKTKGNFDMPAGTSKEADFLGDCWTGPNAKLVEYNGQPGKFMRVSQDGMRQYRPPVAKGDGRMLANFQWKDPVTGTWLGNGHMTIKD